MSSVKKVKFSATSALLTALPTGVADGDVPPLALVANRLLGSTEHLRFTAAAPSHLCSTASRKLVGIYNKKTKALELFETPGAPLVMAVDPVGSAGMSNAAAAEPARGVTDAETTAWDSQSSDESSSDDDSGDEDGDGDGGAGSDTETPSRRKRVSNRKRKRLAAAAEAEAGAAEAAADATDGEGSGLGIGGVPAGRGTGGKPGENLLSNAERWSLLRQEMGSQKTRKQIAAEAKAQIHLERVAGVASLWDDVGARMDACEAAAPAAPPGAGGDGAGADGAPAVPEGVPPFDVDAESADAFYDVCGAVLDARSVRALDAEVAALASEAAGETKAATKAGGGAGGAFSWLPAAQRAAWPAFVVARLDALDATAPAEGAPRALVLLRHLLAFWRSKSVPRGEEMHDVLAIPAGVCAKIVASFAHVTASGQVQKRSALLRDKVVLHALALALSASPRTTLHTGELAADFDISHARLAELLRVLGAKVTKAPAGFQDAKKEAFLAKLVLPVAFPSVSKLKRGGR